MSDPSQQCNAADERWPPGARHLVPQELHGRVGLGEESVRLDAQLEPVPAQRDAQADADVARGGPARAAHRLERRRFVAVGGEPEGARAE